MFRIDDKFYDVEFLAKDGYKQTADILNGEHSGRLQGTGEMFLEYVGTYFNSDIKLRRGRNCTDEQWNDLFLHLANPINRHNIDIPFGNGILTLDIYVAKVQRTLANVTLGELGNINVWEKVIAITATPIESSWLAGGRLVGYSEV
jgi:hypothetical protein